MNIFAKLIAGTALLAAANSAYAGETLDRVMENKAMVVATNSSWPPQSFLDDNNEMVGFDIDVSREIAKRLGVEVSFQTPDWATLTGGRWQGRYDIGVGSVTPTKARAQVIDFAGIYYYSPYVYVVHKDSPAKAVSDLNGKVIGVETATTSEDFIRRQLEIDAPGLPPIEYKLEPGEIRTFADSMLPFDGPAPWRRCASRCRHCARADCQERDQEWLSAAHSRRRLRLPRTAGRHRRKDRSGMDRKDRRLHRRHEKGRHARCPDDQMVWQGLQRRLSLQ